MVSSLKQRSPSGLTITLESSNVRPIIGGRTNALLVSCFGGSENISPYNWESILYFSSALVGPLPAEKKRKRERVCGCGCGCIY